MKLRPTFFFACILLFGFALLILLAAGFLYAGLFSFHKESVLLGVIALILCGVCMKALLYLWQLTKEKLQFVSISDKALTITKPLNGAHIRIELSQLKGYSKTLDDRSHNTGIFKTNTLTIYFDGHHGPIELVQYQADRITEFEIELNQMGIQYLGEESILRGKFGKRITFAYWG